MLVSLLPEATITAAVLATGFQQQQRKLDPVALVRALVLSGGTPDGGRQADALRARCRPTFLAVTMADSGATSAEWDRFAALIQHVGKDPNWRRRPSAIDQVKGRIVTHGRPRAQRSVTGSAQNA